MKNVIERRQANERPQHLAMYKQKISAVTDDLSMRFFSIGFPDSLIFLPKEFARIVLNVEM